MHTAQPAPHYSRGQHQYLTLGCRALSGTVWHCSQACTDGGWSPWVGETTRQGTARKRALDGGTRDGLSPHAASRVRPAGNAAGGRRAGHIYVYVLTVLLWNPTVKRTSKGRGAVLEGVGVTSLAAWPLLSPLSCQQRLCSVTLVLTLASLGWAGKGSGRGALLAPTGRWTTFYWKPLVLDTFTLLSGGRKDDARVFLNSAPGGSVWGSTPLPSKDVFRVWGVAWQGHPPPNTTHRKRRLRRDRNTHRETHTQRHTQTHTQRSHTHRITHTQRHTQTHTHTHKLSQDHTHRDTHRHTHREAQGSRRLRRPTIPPRHRDTHAQRHTRTDTHTHRVTALTPATNLVC